MDTLSTSLTQKTEPLGIVLSAGGARAAYQVGVLKYIAEAFPEFNPRVFTGISAGSINAAFLSQGQLMPQATTELYALWSKLNFDQVLQTHFSSILRLGLRWLYDLFISKVTERLLLKSILDASPLAHTLLLNIHFWKINRAIREGQVLGLGITATNYLDGITTTFFDSYDPILPWTRERRNSVRTALRLKHVMASCSIPILFEPIAIGKCLFGDGSLRFNFPLSPAIHLGARKILSIGIRTLNQRRPKSENKLPDLSIGYVAGSVLNSIFLDALDFDYENLSRINQIVGPASSQHVPILLLRPSQDLGRLAGEFLDDVPFHFRQLLRATARREEVGDLLSYLMFSPNYIRALLQLGYEDAKLQRSEIGAFLRV